MYEGAPARWFDTEELVWFPTSYNRCKLEKAVEDGDKPLPRKDFKQFTVKVLFETGTGSIELFCLELISIPSSCFHMY